LNKREKNAEIMTPAKPPLMIECKGGCALLEGRRFEHRTDCSFSPWPSFKIIFCKGTSLKARAAR